MINRLKIHRMVEYIKLVGFAFETDEVIENLDKILAHYNVADIYISEDEYYFLIDELLPLADDFEFREAQYISLQTSPLIAEIKDNELNLRLEEIKRKLTKANSDVSVEGFLYKLALV